MLDFNLLKRWLAIAITLQVCVGLVYAQDQKPSTAYDDVSAFKAPPRSIKDVLNAIERTKIDPEESAKAKVVLARPIPEGSDVEQMHAYYKARSKAHQQIGRNDLALADIRLATGKFKSSDKRSELESLIELGIYESRGGNLKSAIAAFEQAKAGIPRHLMGFYMSTNRLLVGSYAQAGNFEASDAALRDADSTLVLLKRSPNYTEMGPIWESNLEAARAFNFMAQGRWVEAERASRLSIQKIDVAAERYKNEAKVLSGAEQTTAVRNEKNSKQYKIARQLDYAHSMMMQGRW